MRITRRRTPHGRRLAVLTLTALGVVYGDIGTSPLYALKECFEPGATASRPTPANVLGVLSLIFWSLILVVSVKYLVFILRADNRGEGGILALLALVLQRQHRRATAPARRAHRCSALFGAALLYGDGIITPADLGARRVEGLEVATRRRSSTFVVPITFVILLALFCVQRHGTARVGGGVRPDHARLVRHASACSASREIVRAPATCSPRSTRGTRCSFFVDARLRGLPRARRGGARRSPAARRSTPTWATSAGSRSGSPGSRSCSRRCCSTTSGRARCCSRDPGGGRRTRSICSRRSWFAVSAARHRDAGGDRRVAGADLRRVLAHAAGGAARLHRRASRSCTRRSSERGRSTSPRSTRR